MLNLNQRSMLMACRTAESGFDAAVTIAARTPDLMTPGFDRSGDKAREAGLMIQEKFSAAYEGVCDAQLVWSKFFIRAAFGGVTMPHQVSHHLVDVAEAAMEPARLAVQANARRLTGRKTSP